MQWYNELSKRIEKDRTYSHKELARELEQLKPQLSRSAYNWAINNLVHSKALEKLGYDTYALPSGVKKNEYFPIYSEDSKKIIDMVAVNYQHVQFTVFETTLMNEFLNHLIAQNTIFLQVEKEVSIFVFRFLQEQGYKNVLYKPNKKDFDLYWERNCIVVTDLSSEAPLKTSAPHAITLEKLLVDLVADKLISTTYSSSELPDLFQQAQDRYLLDKVRLFRYARRRNKQELLAKYLREENS